MPVASPPISLWSTFFKVGPGNRKSSFIGCRAGPARKIGRTIRGGLEIFLSVPLPVVRNRFVDEGTSSGCQRLDWPWNNAVYLHRGFLIRGISFGIFFRLVKFEITFGRRGPGSIKKKRRREREGQGEPDVPDRPIRQRGGVLPFQFCSLLYFSASIFVPRSPATRSSKFHRTINSVSKAALFPPCSVADWKRAIGNKNAAKISKGIFYAQTVSFARKFQRL